MGDLYPEAEPQPTRGDPVGRTHRSPGMIKHPLTIGLALIVAFGPWSPVLAKDYNTGRPYLPPSGQVKINNARAQLFAIRREIEEQAKKAEETGGDTCPDGVFVDRSNPRREVIIATRDIVNLGGQLDLSASCR